MVHENSSKESDIKIAIKQKDIKSLRKLAVSKGGLLTDELRKQAWPVLLNIDMERASPPLYNYNHNLNFTSHETNNNNLKNNSNNNNKLEISDNNNNTIQNRPHEYFEVVEKDVVRCLWKHSSDHERDEKRKQVAAAVHGILIRQNHLNQQNENEKENQLKQKQKKQKQKILLNKDKNDLREEEEEEKEEEFENSEEEMKTEYKLNEDKYENDEKEEKSSLCSSSMDELEEIAETEFGIQNNNNLNNNNRNNNNNNNNNYSTKTTLHYYQGFHEVVGVFILTCGAHIGSICAEHVARGHLHRFMDSPSLRSALEQLNLLIPLIAQHEPNVGSQLDLLIPDGGSGLAFALPWILTWFAHVIDDLSVVARLFDLFVASDPLMPLYFSAAIMCHFKESIMEATDYPGVFAILARLPQDLPFEDLVIKADQMMTKTPPDTIGKVLKHQPMVQPLQFLSLFSLREFINVWGNPNNKSTTSSTTTKSPNESEQSESSKSISSSQKTALRPWQVLFLLSGASLATVMALYLGNKNI